MDILEKNLNEAKKHLKDTEEVLGSVMGTLDGKITHSLKNVIFIATSERLLYFRTKVLGEVFGMQEIKYEDIKYINIEKRLIHHNIILSINKNIVFLKMVKPENALNFIKAIKEKNTCLDSITEISSYVNAKINKDRRIVRLTLIGFIVVLVVVKAFMNIATDSDVSEKTKGSESATSEVNSENKNVELKDLRKIVEKHFGKDKVILCVFNEAEGFLNIKAYAKDGFSGKGVQEGIWMDTKDVLKELKDLPEVKDVNFNIAFPVVDSYGNEKEAVIMKLSFPFEVREKINWINFKYKNIPNIAQGYWEGMVFDN